MTIPNQPRSADAADLLIIGSGGAGLPAAVVAAGAGAKVIVLEKRKQLGGTARFNAGVFAVGSPAQERQGITSPTIDEYFREHMDYGGWFPEAPIVRGWLNNCGETIKWLEDKGLRFHVGRNLSGDMMTMHQVVDQSVNSGNAITNALIAEAEQLGVDFVTETEAKKLLQDDAGRVTGVLAKQQGQEVVFEARSVMLATGTMSRNPELQKRYLPHIDFGTMPVMMPPFQTGDGFVMAVVAGAAEDGRVAPLFIGPCNHPNNTRVGSMIRRPFSLWVNKYGVRFCDESLFTQSDFGFWAAHALDRQPDRMCYVLFDDANLTEQIENRRTVCGMEEVYGRIIGKSIAATHEAGDRDTGIVANEEVGASDWLLTVREDLAEEAEAGRVMIADTLAELSEWMGADPDVLAEQVARYNQFSADGKDADFLKGEEWLRPLAQAPFYAIRATQAMDQLGGGIRVSPRMEVLDKELRPIPGLYAGGLACSGWFGVAAEATGSCCISFCLHSGRVAGEEAARYAAV